MRNVFVPLLDIKLTVHCVSG